MELELETLSNSIREEQIVGHAPRNISRKYCIILYVIGSEKTTLMAQIYKIAFLTYYESVIFAEQFAIYLSCIAPSVTKL